MDAGNRYSAELRPVARVNPCDILRNTLCDPQGAVGTIENIVRCAEIRRSILTEKPSCIGSGDSAPPYAFSVSFVGVTIGSSVCANTDCISVVVPPIIVGTTDNNNSPNNPTIIISFPAVSRKRFYS